VMVLRHTQPNLERPYRTWGYPVTPIIFLIVTAFMMGYLLIERPLQSFAGLATLAAGLAIYFIALHAQRRCISRSYTR
jgi:APA family basic amino acid/polyamine antiporter